MENDTVTLPIATVLRTLAVLDDAEQAYGDLIEAGAAHAWSPAEAEALAALYRELDAVRCAASR